MKKAAVIMGSDSDLPVVEKAFAVFEEYGVPYEVHVYSAHRTPVEARIFAQEAADKGFGVIVAAAGKAAHLAGSLAANTVLPVIGIPVATVAIDGAQNAALLAVEILAVSDAALAEKLMNARRAATEKVLKKDAEIAAKYNK